MEANQTLSIYNNIVYFGVHKFCCDEIRLISAGIKFFQVCQVQERSRFNITIPPIDIKKAYFDSKTDENLSTLVIETVPESGRKIRETLHLNEYLNQDDNSEGSLRFVVQLNGNGEEIYRILEEYFAIFNSVTWRLERTLSISVHQYFNFLNNYSQQSTITTSNLGTSSMPAQSPSTNILTSQSEETSSMSVGNRNSNQRNSNNSASNSDDVLLSYPPGEKKCISIRQSDLSCLEEGQQINDRILSFYLKYIERDLTAPDIAQRSYIFSSSFYDKLAQRMRVPKAQTQDNKLLSEKYYKRVKNWTKDINIFAKDFLIIPINKSSHWLLAIICYPRKVPFTGQNLPIEIEKHPKRPRILFLDSLQSSHDKCGLAAPLRHFLTKEWEVKISSSKNFSIKAMPNIYLKVPKQYNAFDGGLYVITCIENFLRNPDYLLDKICLDPAIDLGDWFSSTLVSSKRRTIKRLIKQQREVAEKKKNGVQ